MKQHHPAKKLVALTPFEFARASFDTDELGHIGLYALNGLCEKVLLWVADQLVLSRSLYFSKVGYLTVRHKAARPGRNPKTGEAHMISARKSVKLTRKKPKEGTIHKKDFKVEIAREFGLSQDQAGAIYDLLSCMVLQVAEGICRLEFRGFGGFYPSFRAPRVGRNPKTGESVDVPEQIAVLFKAYKPLHVALNGEVSKEK